MSGRNDAADQSVPERDATLSPETDGDEDGLSPRERRMQRERERYAEAEARRRKRQAFDPETDDPTNTDRLQVHAAYHALLDAGHAEDAREIRSLDTVKRQKKLAQQAVREHFDTTLKGVLGR